MKQVQHTGGERFFVLGNHVQACTLQVPRLPQPGETLAASAVHIEPGGKGLNVAVGLHRQDCSVAALFPVGRDAGAAALQALLDSEGMSGARCVSLDGPSGFGVGLIAADGQNSIAVCLGANALLTGALVSEQATQDIAEADWVYCPFELSMEAVAATLRLGRASGAFNVVNPSPFAAMAADFWALCDGIIANETEAQALLGLSSQPGVTPSERASAAQWMDWFEGQPELRLAGEIWPGRWLVVTLGDQGALMWRPGAAPLWCPAPEVKAVDTVGCGDAFVCGFLPVWARTGDAAAALRAGNACGAHMAAHHGVLDALPRRETRVHEAR